MTTSDHRHSNHRNERNNGPDNHTKDEEIDSELVELETALNDIEKAMDKIESQNSNIQTKLRDLLESNRQMAKEFTDIRRGMANKFKDVTHDLEQTPGTAHDLAAVTSSTIMSLLTRTILRVTSRRFASTVGSNPQGIQDDPALAANFIPDFTFPQGLQGEILNGNANDAICQLWLEKCKLYGYDNCEERLHELLASKAIEKK